jgi:glycosyltransferase involved in cell wall biosynthesis
MVIAVNTRFLLRGRLEGCGYFIQETFRILTHRYPQHQFFFLFDRPYSQEFVFSENVKPVVVSPAARTPLLWKIWFDFRIPSLLKKIRADVFVSPDGFCSLRSTVPQCLIVHDLAFLHHPSSYKKNHIWYLKRYMPDFLKKASGIATVSDFSKKDLVKQYHLDPSAIKVVYNGVRSSFGSFDRNREIVKIRYTEGMEYFIYIGAIQPRKNLLQLLKAFSVFKKRMQSNMKLVFAGRMAWKNENFVSLLKSYKYRHDLVFTDYLEDSELADLLSASYALVYPSLFEGFGVPVLEAMKSGVPALTSENSSMQEIAGDAGLYFDPNNYNDIAEKMMMIYKDETLRIRMIEDGKRRAENFSWEHTAELLWEVIARAASTRNQ